MKTKQVSLSKIKQATIRVQEKSLHDNQLTQRQNQTVLMTLTIETEMRNLERLPTALLFFLKRYCAQIELRQQETLLGLFPGLSQIQNHPVENRTSQHFDETGQCIHCQIYEAEFLHVVHGYNDIVLEY